MVDRNLYFLALIPDDKVCVEVMAYKEEVAEKFNSKGALKSPPHITLHMPFKWREDREEQLITLLSKFSFDNDSFVVGLRGFGFFEPRVVYVDVEANETLQLLQKQLVRFARRELKILNADYKDRGFQPHMTIGFRDLKKSIFPDVKNYYSRQDYRSEFAVKGFWLLKHDGNQWYRFQFFECL